GRRSTPCCRAPLGGGGLGGRPPTATVALGGTQQFGAFLFDQPTGNVTWSTTGGTVDGSGRFTAGSQPGSVEVRATSTVDQSVAKSAVTVSSSATTTTVPSTSTSTTLPMATGTATVNVNEAPVAERQFVVAGALTCSIIDTSGGGSDASASWGGATMFFGSSTCPGAEYELHDVGGSFFTMFSPVGGQLTIGGIQVTSPAGGCFTSSGT